MKGREQEDWVDDITWNDLSMNQVFQRINSCDTSAGEEILYWRLRKNGMTPEECVSFEEKIRTFSENEKEREDVERLLWKIGKSPSSYYRHTWTQWKSTESGNSGCYPVQNHHLQQDDRQDEP